MSPCCRRALEEVQIEHLRAEMDLGDGGVLLPGYAKWAHTVEVGLLKVTHSVNDENQE